MLMAERRSLAKQGITLPKPDCERTVYDHRSHARECSGFHEASFWAWSICGLTNAQKSLLSRALLPASCATVSF